MEKSPAAPAPAPTGAEPTRTKAERRAEIVELEASILAARAVFATEEAPRVEQLRALVLAEQKANFTRAAGAAPRYASVLLGDRV